MLANNHPQAGLVTLSCQVITNVFRLAAQVLVALNLWITGTRAEERTEINAQEKSQQLTLFNLKTVLIYANVCMFLMIIPISQTKSITACIFSLITERHKV